MKNAPCLCPKTDEQVFRIDFVRLDQECIGSAICAICDGFIGSGQFELSDGEPAYGCVCCSRELATCIRNPCAGRDPMEPWRLRV